MSRTASLIAFAVLVAACATESEPLISPDVTGPSDTSVTLENTLDTAPAANPNLAPVAIAARVDLASRLDVAESDIVVSSLAAVSWRDGSIGCPEEGMSYTQALVDGTRVVLEHNGQSYAYHKAADGEVFLCEQPVVGSFDVSKDGNADLELIPPPGMDE